MMYDPTGKKPDGPDASFDKYPQELAAERERFWKNAPQHGGSA